MMVADTGPLIAFARASRLDLLRQVIGELIIPEAVYDELVGKGQQRPGAVEVERAEWIRRRAISDQTAIAHLPSTLHTGERHAILLAQELGLGLLIDERRGRRIAAERGVEVFGSLWILAEAKRRGIITQTRPLVVSMQADGYWIDEDLLRLFFQQLGEGTA
jgi:predicted nucleic acid-binding protein